MGGSRRGGGGTGAAAAAAAAAGGNLFWGKSADPRIITVKLSHAERPQDILHVVKKVKDNELLVLNYIHVATAFNRLGKTGKKRPLSSRRCLATDEAFQELLRLVLRFAENQTLGAQAVANITHGIASLRETGWLSGGVLRKL